MAVKNHANSPVDRHSYKSLSVVDVVQFMFLSMLLINITTTHRHDLEMALMEQD